jgi:ferredoxin
MASAGEQLKDFVRGQGVEVVGVAGPDRLDGPPSLDPSYTMPGARSIVSFALPMDVGAIYKFLSKQSPSPHNIDQVIGNQAINDIGWSLADHIRALGYRAEPVPANNTYRRSLDVFSTHPSFSHRFGAIASGIAGQGWSGNVMTREYGAAVYLGTVVTDALLESDEPIPPRYFVDNYCSACKVCAKTCVAGMFEADEEDYVLLNGELHPRGRRRNLDLCNASCFGLHGLSKDKAWSSWGRHWITDWVGRYPEPDRFRVRRTLMTKGGGTGDAAPRFEVIKRTASLRWPEAVASIPPVAELPDDQDELDEILHRFGESIGVPRLRDPNVLTCGQCAMVCGPGVSESRNRYRALVEGGIVVPGPEGRMTRVSSYAEALEYKKKYPKKVNAVERARDSMASMRQWYGYYFGFEPRSFLQALAYDRKLKRAATRYRLAVGPSCDEGSEADPATLRG